MRMGSKMTKITEFPFSVIRDYPGQLLPFLSSNTVPGLIEETGGGTANLMRFGRDGLSIKRPPGAAMSAIADRGRNEMISYHGNNQGRAKLDAAGN